ncbi:MAG: tail fiber domain-containing protein [Nanoarchaeota archaeon]|nr:tail fiber domain-containing protein [Nanoarchaeota archaeon]
MYVNGTVCLDLNQDGTCDDNTAAISDIRVKKNIEAIENPLDIIQQLRGISFNWKSEEYPELRLGDKRQIGMIAQEVEDVLPEVVLSGVGDDNLKMIDYSKFTPLLIEGIKELKAEKDNEIELLKAENQELKQENKEILSRLEALENK